MSSSKGMESFTLVSIHYRQCSCVMARQLVHPVISQEMFKSASHLPKCLLLMLFFR